MSSVMFLEGHEDCPSFNQLPEWMRIAVIDEGGTVHLSAVVAGIELVVLMFAKHDGVPVIQLGDHPYFPTYWLASEFPDARDLVRTLERGIMHHR